MNELKGKKCLITGATGLIGKHLVDKLKAQGAIIFAMGRDHNKLQACFDYKDDSFTMITGNISDRIPDNIVDIDYIFHAAGSISGKTICEKPVEIVNANIYGLVNCLEFLKNQRHGRLIVFSSATVYGTTFKKDSIVDESCSYECDNLANKSIAYSESKRMAEVIATSYMKQFGVDVVIARMSYVYGFSRFSPNTAFFSFVDDALNERNIKILSSGLPCRDNIYIDDVIDGILTIATHGTCGEVYNISSNGDKNNYLAMDQIAIQISDIVSRKYNKKCDVILPQNNVPRAPGLRMNNTKLKSLGWDVLTDSNMGLSNTIQFYAVEHNII